jgi:transposase
MNRVRIIGPQFVKPLVRGDKNDGNDAEAICEAVQRPSMCFVPLKTVAQRDIQSLHRCRQRLVNHRTALISQMRGVLLDRGIAFGKSASRARTTIPRIIAEAGNGPTAMTREVLASLFEFLGCRRYSNSCCGARSPHRATPPFRRTKGIKSGHAIPSHSASQTVPA